MEGENGEMVIHVGSRTQDVTNDRFRGATEYVKKHEGIGEYLKKFPSHRLYWEWLIAHTITNYNAENYNHFYLFDIENGEWERTSQQYVREVSGKYGIRTPNTFAIINRPGQEDILQFVGKSCLGPIWEWVVIKNEEFINKFGDRCYAKWVSDGFKEENNIVFGNAEANDVEAKLVGKYIGLERVKKVINKVEQNEDKNISREDMAKIIGMTHYDFLQEEFGAIAKMWIVNFHRLSSLSTKKIARIALDYIDGNALSIAFNQK